MQKPENLGRTLLAIILFFCIQNVAQPGTAQADVALGADLDYAVPVDDEIANGWGFGARLGNRFDGTLSAVTPELTASVGRFPSYSTYRGLAGFRLAVGAMFMGGVFGHVGIGRLTAESNGASASHTAFAFDAGGFLDFTLVPVVNVGLHGVYNRLSGADEADPFVYLTFGMHADFIW